MIEQFVRLSSYIRGEGGSKDTQITLKDNRATVMRADQNAEYISKIRMRLCDDALARKVQFRDSEQ